MKLFLHLLSYLFISVSWQQTPLNFVENFDNNDLNWPILSSQTSQAVIDSGTYQLHHTSSNPLQYITFLKELFIDDSNNFTIEVKLRHTAGTYKTPYSILWGSNTWKNCNFLTLTGDKHYQIGQFINGYKQLFIDWRYGQFSLNKDGEYNIIKIQKQDNHLLFKFNNEEVYSTKYHHFMGKQFGFILTGTNSIEVDYVKVYQFGNTNINLVAHPINGFVKENLGSNINVAMESERWPVVSSDGKTLYFLHDEPNGQSDIYFSKKDSLGNWQKSVHMGKPLNNSSNNFVVSVSPDENTLIVGETYDSLGDFAGTGISITHRTNNGWEIPKKININQFYNYGKFQSYGFSPDQKVLIMGLERKDTYGGQDLYISFLDSGNYSSPKNLGEVLNTKGNEYTPFIANDGKTLYFSSDGLPGYGSNDIFISHRLDSTWLHWSAPQNLGPEINTNEWDAYFSVPGNGEYAYIVRSLIENAYEDIFQIKLSQEAKPDPVVILSGRINDAINNNKLEATLFVYEIHQKDTLLKQQIIAFDGEYKTSLNPGKVYLILGKKTGYSPISKSIDLSKVSEYAEMNQNFKLHPIDEQAIATFENILFKSSLFTLSQYNMKILDSLSVYLQTNPKMHILLSGNTDSDGNENDNILLSQKREQSVQKYLIEKGVSPSQIKTAFFGESKPIYSNKTAEGKAKNRRVEIHLY